MLGWYDRRQMRLLYDSLPKDSAMSNLGDGFSRRQWDALNELARRDGFRLECVAYSGVPDYQLLPILPPLDTAALADPSSWRGPECGAPMEQVNRDDWKCTVCPYTQ